MATISVGKRVDGNQAVKRSLNQVVFGSGTTTISAGTGATAFRSMAASPEGKYVIVFTGSGNAYIYDATASWSRSKTVSSL